MIDIVDWSQSKLGFYVDRHPAGKTLVSGGWQPVALSGYHADLLRHCFTPDEHGAMPYNTVLWCEPCKSGKTMLAALISLYFALFVDVNSSVIMASNSQKQATSLMFKSLSDSVENSPLVSSTDVTRTEIAFSKTGNLVRAIPSSSRSAAGERFTLALFDEPAGYQYIDQERLFSEFKPDPTRQNCVRLMIGYAGYSGESLLWEKLLTDAVATGEPVLEHIQNPDGSPACYQSGRTFVFWSHQTRQPWQTDAWHSEMRKMRGNEYERQVLTQFVESTGDFVPLDSWTALINPGLKPLAPGSQERLYVGLDLATAIKGDDCALVGCYQKDGKVCLGLHKVWTGKTRKTQLRLSETVYPYIMHLQDNYNLQGVWLDPFQGVLLAELLRKKGIHVVEVTQSRQNRGPKDTSLYDLIVNGNLVLYDHEEVRRAVLGASAKTLPDGSLFLTKGGTANKIDFLVALANVASEARAGRGVTVASFASIERQTQSTYGDGPIGLVFVGDAPRITQYDDRRRAPLRPGDIVRVSRLWATRLYQFGCFEQEVSIVTV